MSFRKEVLNEAIGKVLDEARFFAGEDSALAKKLMFSLGDRPNLSVKRFPGNPIAFSFSDKNKEVEISLDISRGKINTMNLNLPKKEDLVFAGRLGRLTAVYNWSDGWTFERDMVKTPSDAGITLKEFNLSKKLIVELDKQLKKLGMKTTKKLRKPKKEFEKE